MLKIKLNKVSTNPSSSLKKEKIKKETDKYIYALSELQNLLYAEAKHSLLIVIQGMDASGKDGAIKKVFTGINPMGCKIKSFKKPTEEEMSHDFLWRVHSQSPAKGMIVIFNRSHYEDVIIQRVHKWVDMKTIKKRYGHINAFEKLLRDNNTTILKFYLHVSHDEQVKRLNERMADPSKMWKYNPEDLRESELWDEYMLAYEDAFTYCGAENPWIIIPSDKNWYKEYLISKSIVETLTNFQMHYPGLKNVSTK